MGKTSFIVVRFKSLLLPFSFCMFIVFLIFFSSSNIASAKSGLCLWANAIVPTLFPFLVATELLSHTFVIKLLGKLFKNIMKPLFNVSGEGAFAFIMGIISGYPVGAKIVSDLYTRNVCTKEEAERLLAFTNNSGPLFIIGTVRN